jgi:cobalt-zinc-cadmium efflux system membrane fusion protein
MKRRCSYVLVAMLTVHCGGRREEPAPAPSQDTHGKAAEGHEGTHRDEGPETHEAEPAVVEIDEEMLRDLRITTAVAESRPATEGAPVLGELHVDETRYAEVGVPVPARAVRVRVNAGQKVRRGDVLAELSSLDVGRTRAEDREAAARVELARQALARKRQLAEERIAPRREVQEAEAELEAAEASLQAARSQLAAMGAGGGAGASLVLRAPMSGVVLERKLVDGQVADPAQTLFRVGDLSRLWVVAHAPERDAVRVREGATARVSFPALPGRSFTGRVLSVGSQVEVSARTIPVRIGIENESGLLRPGMSASVWLAIGEAGASVIAVPTAALQRMDDKWAVFVPGEAGHFHVRTVGRGRDLGGEVEIVSGLRAGEAVVVEGAFLLKAEAEKARGEGGHHEH